MRTNLIERSKDGHLVMTRATKCSPMVQMDRESVITKHLEGLVVVAIHVAHQEVKNGQVHHI